MPKVITACILAMSLVSGSAHAGWWWTFFFPAEDTPRKEGEASIVSTPQARQCVEEVRAMAVATRGKSAAEHPEAHRALWEALPSYTLPDETLAQGVERFIEETLEADPAQLLIERYLNPGDVSEGVSEDPIFFISENEAGLVAVVKAFRADAEDLRGFARELSALALLESLDLQEAETVTVLAVGRISGARGEYALMTMSAAPGISVTRHLKNVGLEASDSPGRKRKIAVVRKAVTALGAALAELHASRAVEGGEIAPLFWERDDNRVNRFLKELRRSPELTGISTEEFELFFADLRARRRAHGHTACFVHGDAHTGNYLYEPSTETLTVIDVGRLARSVDEMGEPHGCPECDFVMADAFIDGVGAYYGLSKEERCEVRRLFDIAYLRFPGIRSFCSECLSYHRFVFWASTVALYRQERLAQGGMQGQLAAFVDLAIEQLEQMFYAWVALEEEAA